MGLAGVRNSYACAFRTQPSFLTPEFLTHPDTNTGGWPASFFFKNLAGDLSVEGFFELLEEL